MSRTLTCVFTIKGEGMDHSAKFGWNDSEDRWEYHPGPTDDDVLGVAVEPVKDSSLEEYAREVLANKITDDLEARFSEVWGMTGGVTRLLRFLGDDYKVR